MMMQFRHRAGGGWGVGAPQTARRDLAWHDRAQSGHPATPAGAGLCISKESWSLTPRKRYQRRFPSRPISAVKRNLARQVIALIEATPHELYAEPFVGMGGVFLRRRAGAKVEVINDLSGDVANFFRILQRHLNPLLDMLRWQVTSRAHFDRLMATDAATLTDLERAVRFLYIQRLAFGGKVSGRNFGVSRSGPARFDITKLVPILEAAHERLSGVVIERLPYAEFVGRYDRKGALFYLDPPYFGSEGDYGAGLFDRDDFEVLATVLSGLQGRFILSINDVPEIRRIFARFAVREVEATYSVGGGAQARRFSELLITGPHE
jgi:DNA adenine methylase